MSKESVFIEKSQAHRKNKIIIGVAVLGLTLLFALSVYKWVVLGIRNPIEAFIYLMFAYVLFERAQAKYICELGKKSIVFTKQGLWGTQTHEVAYKDINGVYGYKTKLVQVIKFRRTYRLNSALDNRPVWVLAYSIPDNRGKIENRRIYFKASDELLNLMAEKMPNQVKVTEEQVVLSMINK